MSADYAAGYCGEPSVDEFLKRVGTEYPLPYVDQGRRRLWLRDDLDEAMGLAEREPGHWDAAEVL